MVTIVAVAIQTDDGLIYSLSTPYRHHDVIRLMLKHRITGINNQGFLTSEGHFVRRVPAADIALKAGQIKQLISPPILTSEDLW